MHSVGLKIYAPRLIYYLLEDDSDQTLQFCETVLIEECEGDSNLHKILSFYEANVKLSVAVYRYNCVQYSNEKNLKSQLRNISVNLNLK